MKIFFIVFSVISVLAVSFVSPYRAEANPQSRFYFNYISNDGSIYLDCEYSVLKTEPDFYHVECGKNTNIKKVFDARFRVRPLRVDPKPVYEIAYWVTDRNKQDRWDEGSTTWITLSKGSVTDVALHQEVENSYAALVVHYSNGK